MMVDDDIIFLGSSNGLQSSSSYLPHRPVTGIILHIEKQHVPGTGCRMLFRKASTSVVHIGRRSGLEPDTTHTRSQDHEQGDAMFRCAVVSRKHARIAFSDSGHAYLIDLGSHHGTHIRKQGEKFSKMIKPETSTMLADGDIVTFGKAVGKGDEMVKPIVARIELLYAGNNPSANNTSTTPFKPLVVPSTSSPSSSDRSTSKSAASGRYGIHTSSSSSDDSYSSSPGGMYSDIEEIPPPLTSAKPSAPQSNTTTDKPNKNSSVSSVDDNNGTDGNASAGQGSLGQALNVLRRLLPPSQPSQLPPPSTPRRLPSATGIVERPFSQMAHVSSFFFGPDPPVASSQSLPPSSPPLGMPLLHMLPLAAGTMRHRPSTTTSLTDFHNSENITSEPLEQKSRSNSPMDLASPSPVPEDVTTDLPPALSVSSSLVVSATPPPHMPPLPTLPPIALPSPETPKDINPPSPSPEKMNIPLVNSPEDSGNGRKSPIPRFRYPSSDFDDLMPRTPPLSYMGGDYYALSPEYATPQAHQNPSTSSSNLIVTPARVKRVEDSIEDLKADVAKLNSHRRKYKARFNSNVQVISEKLGEFDDRLLEVNAEYILLSNQVERIREDDLTDLNSHLEEMQDSVDEIADERDDIAMDIEVGKKDRENLKATMAELGLAVAELKAFRDETKKQIDEQLAVMQTLHEATAARLAAQEAQQQQTQALLQQCQDVQAQINALANAGVEAAQTPVLTSLKRKRDDTDENEEDVESEKCESENDVNECEMDDGSTATSAGNAPAAEGENSILRDAQLGAQDVISHISDAPPPRKRVRRFAKVVAQTATAVTLGAVVTWSALAFS